MRFSKFIYENESDNLQESVHDCFVDSGLETPGIIGIVYPKWLGTTEEQEFCDWLVNEFEASGPHVVILQKPDITWFNMINQKDVTALAGRVARDRIDGVRYNRLFIALYRSDNPPPESVIVEHDWFFKITENTNNGGRYGAVYEMGEKK